MTRAQYDTLAALNRNGIMAGEPFMAEQIFGARTNEDNGHRRTLRTLLKAGYLGQGEPAWATNAYVMLPGTYERASHYAARYEGGYER